VPRAKLKTLGKEVFAESFLFGSRHRKNTWQTDFFAESQTKSSRHRKNPPKISLPRAKQKTLGKENLKNHFFASNFFLSSTYTYTKLMLKFGTISTLFVIFKILLLSRYFFVCVRYELQVHEII
jgi:hypothetical protein